MPFGSSLQRSTSGTIKATPGVVTAVTYIDTGAVGLGYINLRDGGSGGTIKWSIGSGGQDVANSVCLGNEGVRFDTDIYCEFVAGVAPKCSVAFL